MAIIGQQNINIGAENEAAGSDNLYQAFNKVQNNFTTLYVYPSSICMVTAAKLSNSHDQLSITT